jgi:hypothetical protein
LVSGKELFVGQPSVSIYKASCFNVPFPRAMTGTTNFEKKLAGMSEL